MNNITRIFTGVLFIAVIFACSNKKSSSQEQQDTESSRVFVFSKTEGFRHNSIPDGIALMKRFAKNDQKLSVTATEDATQISSGNLKKYDAVVFLNTTGDVLDETQQAALKKFIQSGGGFMGIHAATDTEYGWPWYGQMIGARFTSHPPVQEATLDVLTKDHPSTQDLPDNWTRTDEWYNFRDIQEHINSLINLNESSYEGGENGKHHPAAWYHEFEGGHIFYTAAGHTSESYDDKLFQQHVMGGLNYVLDK